MGAYVAKHGKVVVYVFNEVMCISGYIFVAN